MMKQFLLAFIFTVFYNIPISHAQDTKVVIDSIEFEGNKKTKSKIMMRELTFAKGDSIPLSILNTTLEQNCLRLMNTNLFFNAKSNVKKWDNQNKVLVQFKVTENWFIFPIPIFELADRNFNVWWKEQKRDFRRTNYGMRLTYNNLTGRRDPLSGLLQLGYTPKYSLSYSLPYLNKKQTLGGSVSYYNAVNREVGFKTDSNKIIFFKDSAKFLQRRTAISAGVSYTPGLFANHYFSIGYSNNKVDTSVGQRLNEDYYLDKKTAQRYIWLYYDFVYDKRDIRPYPIKGKYIQFHIQKNGVFKNDDVNNLDVSLRYTQYIPLTKKWAFETTLKGKTSLVRKQQPYNLSRGLGYGNDFVRGYEYYVTDALDYALTKNTLRFELFNKTLDWRKMALVKRFEHIFEIPFKSYITFNFDAGYSNNPYRTATNTLSNRALYGGGVGLDLIVYYNMVWRFEYSFNHLKEKGLYFSYSAAF